MTDQHVVTVVATRDRKTLEPAYRAVCSCRRWRGATRPIDQYALAEHDGMEHRKYRADVAAIVGRD